jgi:hypothetical protein
MGYEELTFISRELFRKLDEPIDTTIREILEVV